AIHRLRRRGDIVLQVGLAVAGEQHGIGTTDHGNGDRRRLTASDEIARQRVGCGGGRLRGEREREQGEQEETAHGASEETVDGVRDTMCDLPGPRLSGPYIPAGAFEALSGLTTHDSAFDVWATRGVAPTTCGMTISWQSS